MKLADLWDLSDNTLERKLSFISGQIVGSPSSYGLQGPQADSLQQIAGLFAAALVQIEEAKGAYQSALEAKSNLRDTALTLFGRLLNVMYAQPDVTPEAIASLTLTPRKKTKTPVIPVRPLDFLATPSADGTVRLSWNRSGNAYGVIFEVEAAGGDESNWSVVASTTKTKLTLSGCAPGEPKWFRVRATKNGLSSVYSFNAGIYVSIPNAAIGIAA